MSSSLTTVNRVSFCQSGSVNIHSYSTNLEGMYWVYARVMFDKISIDDIFHFPSVTGTLPAFGNTGRSSGVTIPLCAYFL